MITVSEILDDIIRISAPSRVILYGKKIHVDSGEIKSLDFCVTTDQPEKDTFCRLTLEIDYDIPIRFKVYSNSDWDALMHDEESYAYLINQRGTVLYER